MRTKKIELGKLCQDIITGFKGIAICKNEWLNGCVRWTLQPVGLNKDGSYRPTETIDVEQLKVIGDGVKLIVQPSGGSKVGPVRHSGPMRR
jgi:hypothetical protein